MKIAILGATGAIGQRIVAEGLARGHRITAVARQQAALLSSAPGLVFQAANFRAPAELEAALVGHDAVVSAVGPSAGEPAATVVEASRALAAACMRVSVSRVIVVGGAGTLSVEPGLELLRAESFPPDWRDIALAHREALQLWRKVKELDWTVVTPPAAIAPGARTGHYRTGHDDLLLDAQGRSQISIEDFAVAILDELEHGAHLHERITFAY
jgi:putative NADH-flavin reductase